MVIIIITIIIHVRRLLMGNGMGDVSEARYSLLTELNC